MMAAAVLPPGANGGRHVTGAAVYRRDQQARLLGERRECKRRRFGIKENAWMRVKNHYRERCVILRRKFFRKPQHRLMAQMHAVEIAQRHNGALGAGWAWLRTRYFARYSASAEL